MKRRSSGRKQKKRGFFKRFPVWTLWVGGLLATSVYAYIIYTLFVGPISFRWKALYGDVDYPKGYSIQGIDISHYQGTVDWKKLRGASIQGYPVEFVIMKATEGNSIVDETFEENFRQAKRYNFIRGAYHFFVPSIPAEQQAGHFIRRVKLENGDFPPVLDIERKGLLTDGQVREQALKWLHIVERHYKVKPIIYTNFKFKLSYLNDTVFNAYPYWIAHYYVDSIRYKKPWKLWQHTDNGRVDGIEGPVDFDIYNGSMYDLRRFTIGEDK